MAVRLPEMWFWPAHTKKNLKFLRWLHVFDLVLKYCSDLNEGNWLQLLFHFFVLMGIFALVIGLSFFNCVLGFRLKFSRIPVSGKCLQLESKTVLTMTGLILEFFVGICPVSSTSCLHGLKFVWIAQFFFIFDDMKLFR